MNEISNLSNDLNVITAEINSYKQVAGQAIFEIGKRLRHVKKNDLVHGKFGKWLESIDMNHNTANRFMKISSELNSDTYHNLGSNALYLIATISEEEREKEHTLANGETKTPDEMTVRELQEIKKSLKEEKKTRRQAEQQAEQAKKSEEIALQQLVKEKNKPPKTVQVEKIIDNTDHSLRKEVDRLQEEYDLFVEKYELLEEKLELAEDDAERYRKMKGELNYLHSEKDDLHRQIESATSISGLVVEIEHLLMDKLAPIKYSKAIREQSHSQVVIDNLSEIIGLVRSWTDEMEGYLSNNNIIEAEIIDNE